MRIRTDSDRVGVSERLSTISNYCLRRPPTTMTADRFCLSDRRGSACPPEPRRRRACLLAPWRGSATPPYIRLHGFGLGPPQRKAGCNPFDRPLDMLGALSLSKRLRAGDPALRWMDRWNGSPGFSVFRFPDFPVWPKHFPVFSLSRFPLCRPVSALVAYCLRGGVGGSSPAFGGIRCPDLHARIFR